MHAKSVALKPYLLTTLASVSLILLLLKFTWGFWERWDLPLYDGAFYFASAYDFAYYGHFPDPQWSPGFIAYYAPFHLLFEQADLVYVAHRFSIHVILTLLTYFVLRRFSSSMIAWSLTALSLLTVNISMSYYGVHLFVLIPIWLLYAANGLKQITLRRVSIFAVFIVLIYVRPEFALGLSLLLIFWAVKMQQIIRKQTLNNVSSIRQIASLAIMASITLVVIWHTTSGARSMQAFTQHYGWGYSERYPDWEGGIDYWTQSADLINDQFDGASTVSSVVINNPAAFIEHALWNMQISPGVFLQTLTLQVGEIESFLRILFFACLFIVFVRMYYMSESWQQIMGNNQLQLAITIGILGSILVSAIIVRPRVLYLLSLQPLILIFIAIMLEYVLPETYHKRLSVLFVPLILLTLLSFPLAAETTTNSRSVVTIAKALPRYTTPYTIFTDAPTGFCYYFNPEPDMCGGITALGLDSDIDLNQLFDERNVRVILVSDRLLINLSMTQRTQIAALMENPSDFGWTSTDNWLAYRVYSR